MSNLGSSAMLNKLVCTGDYVKLVASVAAVTLIFQLMHVINASQMLEERQLCHSSSFSKPLIFNDHN